MSEIYYADVDDFLRKEARYKILETASNIYNVDWAQVTPDRNHNWILEDSIHNYDEFLAIGSKEGKSASASSEVKSLFKLYSLGVSTNRDTWVYNSQKSVLETNVKTTIDFYNEHIFKYSRLNPKPNMKNLQTMTILV